VKQLTVGKKHSNSPGNSGMGASAMRKPAGYEALLNLLLAGLLANAAFCVRVPEPEDTL